VLTIAADALAPQEMLAHVWLDGQGNRLGGDLHAPRPYKSYDLQPPGLALTVAEAPGGWSLTISATALALFVAVEADRPGRFSANAMTLFPGHAATLTFTPEAPGPAPQFTLRDLYSATCGTA